MSFQEYLKKLGFRTNPFQHTNADNEFDILDKYFIPPDYFEDIWGNPMQPVSNIVYAPRGAGKTAQRIMLEKKAQMAENVLAITYASHDLTKYRSVDEITMVYHYEYLNRLLLISFFSRLSDLDNFDFKKEFDSTERQFIYKLCKIYLFNTPNSFPKQAINSLKTMQDKMKDIWNNFKEPISQIIKEISKNKGVEIDLSKIDIDNKLALSHKDNFFNMTSFLKKIGIDSIYILIDRIDEQDLTGNDPKLSYKFISPLIKDLDLIETPGLGFKFFIWDALKKYCELDARPDRIFSYDLIWSYDRLHELLDKRIKVYTNNQRFKFRYFFNHKKYLGRIVLFSSGSPRDCLRICGRLLSEQYKSNPNIDKFQDLIVNLSIDKFCKEKRRELIKNDNNFKHLTKIDSVCFTIEDLVNKKIAANSSVARNIIQPWTTSGILEKIGNVKLRSKRRAVNIYAFQDVRIARLACPKLNLDDFITQKVRMCSQDGCNNIFFRDFDKSKYSCPDCNTETN